MLFLEILKSPFKYSKDMENASIKDSLMLFGIEALVAVLTVVISLSILVRSLLNKISFFFVQDIPTKYYVTISIILLVAIAIAMAIGSLIIFGIKKISNKEANFYEAMSLLSISLVWPSVILPLCIVALLFGSFSINIIGIILMLSVIIFAVNIYELLKLNNIGSGISLYIASGMVIIYYGVIYGSIYLYALQSFNGFSF